MTSNKNLISSDSSRRDDSTAETPVKRLANMSFEGGGEEKPFANAAISIMGLRRKGINALSDGAKLSDSTG